MSKRVVQRQKLLMQPESAIGLEEAALIFRVATVTARKYVDLGILRSTGRDGNRLVFDKDDTRARHQRFRMLRADGWTIRQIGRTMRGES